MENFLCAPLKGHGAFKVHALLVLLALPFPSGTLKAFKSVVSRRHLLNRLLKIQALL